MHLANIDKAMNNPHELVYHLQIAHIYISWSTNSPGLVIAGHCHNRILALISNNFVLVFVQCSQPGNVCKIPVWGEGS